MRRTEKNFPYRVNKAPLWDIGLNETDAAAPVSYTHLRRISFEYALIDGVNDAPWQADLMVRRLRGMPGHVNLIALNDIAESPLKPSRRMAAFQQQLEERGVTATVRRRLGLDIAAALSLIHI